MNPIPTSARAWLSIVVVGAGPTGVEVAGQIAELTRCSVVGNGFWRAIMLATPRDGYASEPPPFDRRRGQQRHAITRRGVIDIVVLSGRILFAATFVVSAIGHFGQTDAMTGYARSKGVPLARLAMLLGGVLLALGAVSILLGLCPDFGALLLVAFGVPTAVLMHPFWKETDAQAKMMDQVQFFKDTALAGASLLLFALFAHVGDDLALVIVGPLFDL
jgi:putative oxidoreductase